MRFCLYQIVVQVSLKKFKAANTSFYLIKVEAIFGIIQFSRAESGNDFLHPSMEEG